MLVLSSEKNDVVKLRCKKLDLNYKNGVDDKIKYLKNFSQKIKLIKKMFYILVMI